MNFWPHLKESQFAVLYNNIKYLKNYIHIQESRDVWLFQTIFFTNWEICLFSLIWFFRIKIKSELLYILYLHFQGHVASRAKLRLLLLYWFNSPFCPLCLQIQRHHSECQVWRAHRGCAAAAGSAAHQRPVVQQQPLPRPLSVQLWWQVGVSDGETQNMRRSPHKVPPLSAGCTSNSIM